MKSIDDMTLKELIAYSATLPPMNEFQRRRQQISFAYGNVALSYDEDAQEQQKLIEWRDQKLAEIDASEAEAKRHEDNEGK